MSTIIFKDGVLYADTQISGANHLKVAKLWKRQHSIFGIVGQMYDKENFIKDGTIKGQHTEIIEWSGETLRSHCDSGVLVLPHDDYVAFGSGCEYAMGALAAGATPEQALEAAIKHDSSTGGSCVKLSLSEEA